MKHKKQTLAKPAWRPASMGATKGKILGIPTKHLLWGAGGAGASMVTSYIAGALFQPLQTPTLNPTLVGSLVTAVAGYGILSASKGYEKSALPWVFGSLVPLVAKTLYDFFFVTPIPVPTPEPAPELAPQAVPAGA